MNQQNRTLVTKTAPVQAHEIPVSNDDNVRAVYANTVGASGTMTDFRLFFNEIASMPDGKGGSKSVQEVRAIVTLPILAAEHLINVLQQVTKGAHATANQAPAPVNKVERQ